VHSKGEGADGWHAGADRYESKTCEAISYELNLDVSVSTLPVWASSRKCKATEPQASISYCSWGGKRRGFAKIAERRCRL
jgi:hypothetical protein